VGMPVGVGVNDGVNVTLGVAVAVGVKVGVCVDVAVSVEVSVGLGVGEKVAVAVGVEVGLGVRVEVAVCVAVGVRVGVDVDDGVNVGVGVGVGDGVVVGIGVGVSVLTGVREGGIVMTAIIAIGVSLVISVSGRLVVVGGAWRSPKAGTSKKRLASKLMSSRPIPAAHSGRKRAGGRMPMLTTITVTLSGPPRSRVSRIKCRAADRASILFTISNISCGSTTSHKPSLHRIK